MRKSRTQMILVLVVVQMLSMGLATGITAMMNGSQVNREISDGLQLQRLVALDLAKRTELSAEEIIETLSLSTYSMRVVKEGDVQFTAQQQAELSRGASVELWQHEHSGSYFFLRDALVVIEARPYNAMMSALTMRGLLGNLILIAIAMLMYSLVSKRMVQSVVDLTEATRQVAAGNFDARVPEHKRKSLFRPTLEQVVLEQNFNHMVQELKSIEYLRRDFTSNVSHEIKSPIASIDGYAQLLSADGLSDAERREYAAAISTEVRKLASLSDNLLKLTRLESQQIRPPAMAFSLDEQLRRTLNALYPEMERKGLSLSVDLPETMVTADEELLEQVWQNLLGNAVKFTPENGSVHVMILSSANEVSVRIKDTGIGMDAHTLERMYEKFYQADPSHHTGGAGLGLSLARRIVDICGGSMEAKSALGKGSTFVVTLPKG